MRPSISFSNDGISFLYLSKISGKGFVECISQKFMKQSIANLEIKEVLSFPSQPKQIASVCVCMYTCVYAYFYHIITKVLGGHH